VRDKPGGGAEGGWDGRGRAGTGSTRLRGRRDDGGGREEEGMPLPVT